MNVGIRLDRQDFLYDVHSLVKSFFPEDEVSIFTLDDEEKCAVERNVLIDISLPETGNRKETRDALKKSIYETLRAYTGQELPWGTLSGIRPTKIPMKMLVEHHSGEEAVSYLREHYLVSEAKARLAAEIAARERKVLEDVSCSSDDFSLYINIPFCPSICLYCTFSSSPADLWAGRIDEYLDALISEMEEKAEELAAEGKMRSPVTLYIGGGTPTALTARQLDRLLLAAARIWNLGGLREFTVEAGRPDSFTEEKLAVLKEWGVGRISVNPQTMNDSTLELIGRRHTAEDTRRAFRLARDAGFDNINMDIILGLPGEGPEEVRRTLAEITEMKPDSLTVHSLAVKRASRLRQTIREDREKDAGADYGNFGGLLFSNSEDLMRMASDAAASMEMKPYYLYRQKNMKGNLENTGFAAEGKECLYNILIMEELQTIYAFGAGGSTKLVYPDGRIERTVNPKDVKTWLMRRK